MASLGGVAADPRPSIEQSAAATLRSARRALGAALLALILAILTAAVTVGPTLSEHLKPKDAIRPPVNAATQTLIERLDRLSAELGAIRQGSRETIAAFANQQQQQQQQLAQELASLRRENEQLRQQLTEGLSSLQSQMEAMRNASPEPAPRIARRRGRRR